MAPKVQTVEPPLLTHVVKGMEKASLELDTLDDTIRTRIHDIEAVLHKAASIRIAIELSRDQEEITRLTYGKSDGVWGLTVERERTGYDTFNRTRLADAPREARVEMFASGAVEKLIRSAANQLDEQVQKRRKALDAATNLVRGLGIEPSDSSGAPVRDDLPF